MNKENVRNTLFILSTCISLASTSPASAQRMDEMWGKQNTKELKTNEKRGHLFEWGNYAMFIHWGLYSQLGNVWNGKTYYGIGEWMMDVNMANADKNEYKAVARSFNPTQFHADSIVQLAKEAGMKYIIITSKHHDGFAMYQSSCDKFNIVDATPFARDPMKELAEACQREGLGFGFYYSHNQDWTTPGASGASKVDAEGNPKTFDDYFYQKCLPQVEEITQNYGDIELVWFDTPGNMPPEYAQKLVETVHRNQPNALVSGRVGYGLGDYMTLGDMEVPLENIEGLWESVDVTNDSWGYAWYDQNWKSPKQILTYLVSTIARGGTYMLNVGPDNTGRIPAYVSKTLRTAGKWIKRYPEMVYGAEPSPWKHALPWGDAVKQKDKLYLAVYEWPQSGELYVPGLQNRIVSAAIKNEHKDKKITYTKKGNGYVLSLPFKKPDPLIPVIELTLDNESARVDSTWTIDPEIGIKDLSVKFAQTTKCTIHKASWMEKFGEWKHVYCVSDMAQDSRVSWTIDVTEPGTFKIDLTLRGNGRGVWRVETDEGRFIQNQQSISSLFTARPIGWIRFDKTGRHTISVQMPEGNTPCDLAGISLQPIFFE